MGMMGGVFAIASVAGPLLGGWFTEGPGWRWVFWINIPLGLLALAGTAFFLKLPRCVRPLLEPGTTKAGPLPRGSPNSGAEN
jgi:MFS family permease